ncbi:predicted protein [Botrytis cinerea T4]|uniref:Uncharacterized protein n=1 Tax=Botryotinia fuckeliana (strain T4) TaxID=999810 RepID=G2XR97_BOTF4|nr:predicted protein [Botrytis cinerea T4]
MFDVSDCRYRLEMCRVCDVRLRLRSPKTANNKHNGGLIGKELNGVADLNFNL